MGASFVKLLEDIDPEPGYELMQQAVDQGSHWLFVFKPGTLGEKALAHLAKENLENVPIAIMHFGLLSAPELVTVALLPRGRLSRGKIFRTLGSCPATDCPIITMGTIGKPLWDWLTRVLYVPRVPTWN